MEIPINNKKKVEEKAEDPKKVKQAEETADKLQLAPSTRKSNAQKYLGDMELAEDDMVFIARVGKKPEKGAKDNSDHESRLSRSLNKSNEQGVSFRSLIATSNDPNKDESKAKQEIEALSPRKDSCISAETVMINEILTLSRRKPNLGREQAKGHSLCRRRGSPPQ